MISLFLVKTTQEKKKFGKLLAGSLWQSLLWTFVTFEWLGTTESSVLVLRLKQFMEDSRRVIS